MVKPRIQKGVLRIAVSKFSQTFSLAFSLVQVTQRRGNTGQAAEAGSMRNGAI